VSAQQRVNTRHVAGLPAIATSRSQRTKETIMTKTYGFVLLAAACTAAPSEHKLPSATLTPHLDSTPTTNPCGEDVAWNGDTTPDMRYAFSYDGNGLLVHADGVETAGGPDDVYDYTYDGNENMTNMVETFGTYGGTNITAAYDPTNGLTNYTWASTWNSTTDTWTYAMSSFLAPYQPTVEVISEQGGATVNYALAYDGDGRLVTATPDSGDATTYTYDDQAHTITSDTGNGAYHGVYTFDDQFRELSEVWGGTAQGMIDWSFVLAWNGDQLSTGTYSSGTQQAPQTLSVLQVSTMRYDCSMARAGQHTVKLLRPTLVRH
jgi:YD repeat-containing protein